MLARAHARAVLTVAPHAVPPTTSVDADSVVAGSHVVEEVVNAVNRTFVVLRPSSGPGDPVNLGAVDLQGAVSWCAVAIARGV